MKKGKKKPVIEEPEPIILSKKKRQFFISPFQEEIEPDSEPEVEVKEKLVLVNEYEEEDPFLSQPVKTKKKENKVEKKPKQIEDPYEKYDEEYDQHKHMYEQENEFNESDKAEEEIV